MIVFEKEESIDIEEMERDGCKMNLVIWKRMLLNRVGDLDVLNG